MNDARWQRVKRLYWEAHEVAEAEREAFLSAHASDDPEVLEEVRGMLAGEPGDTSDFLEPPLRHTARDVSLPSLPRLLGDDLELVEELGRGGMGVVYRARQLSLDREVAVKVLPADFTLDERLVDRFQREARAVARLHHPGIVPVHTVGRQGNEHYFSMELVHGHDLFHELQRLLGEERGDHFLPDPASREYITRVVQMVRRVANSLAHAHANGIVHRDVKPRNLILEPPPVAGEPPVAMLLDFGLARDGKLGEHSITHTLAGTPYYMSPEQVESARARVDQRTDLYSLGVVLYELLTLQRPFTGKTNLEVMQHITGRVPIPPRQLNPRVPRDLETICLKALEKEPADRYPDMPAFAADLGRFLHHESIEAARPSLVSRGARHVRRHRRSYAAACAGALVLAVAAVAGWALDHAAWVDGLRAEVEQLGAADLAELDVDEVLRLERAATLLAGAVDDGGPYGRTADEALRAVAAHADDCARRGRELVERDLDPVGGRASTPPSDASFHAGLALLRRASRLHPDDAALARDADRASYDPRLRLVLSDELAAAAAEGRVRVSYRQSEWLGLGPRTELAGWQDGDVRLPAGRYRVRIEVAGEGFAECTRFLSGRDSVYEIAPVIRDHESVIADMIHIPAGPAVVGWDSDVVPEWQRRRSVHLDEFWIDETEVTHAEYREFLRATGREPLFLWSRGGSEEGSWEIPEGWEELPVVGCLWSGARDYAEWSGKRLPTWYEWEKAVRGVEGWRVPWAPGLTGDPDELASRATVGVARRKGETEYAHYARAVTPVGSRLTDRSPFGLLDGFGNVAEWTESVYLILHDGRASPMDIERVTMGGAWFRPADDEHLLHIHASSMFNDWAIGFRCVRGAPESAGG